jgi:hypothetical protein
LNNGLVGVSPQTPGGVALPSSIQKNIGKLVKNLRERKFPVFLEAVMKWVADEIEGTQYASYFPSGQPLRRWYRNWLRRMKF